MKNKLTKFSVGLCLISILSGGYTEFKSLFDHHEIQNKTISKIKKIEVVENKPIVNLDTDYTTLNKILDVANTTKNITMETSSIGYSIVKNGIYMAPEVAYTGYQVAKITAKTGYTVAKITPTVVRVGYRVAPMTFKVFTKIVK